jgi:hypothetical protein
MNNPLVVVNLEDLQNIIAQSVAQEFEKQNTPKAEPSPRDENILLTRKETAKLLGVCIATLDNWTREGKLVKYRNSNAVRYNKEEVLASFSTLGKYKR